MKIRPVEADLFHAGGRTDRQTDIYDKGNNPFSQLCDTRLKTIHMSLSLSFTTIFHHQLAPSSCKQSHFGYSHFLLLQTRLLSTTSGPQPCKALKIFAIFFSGCVFPTVEWDGWQFEETRTEIKIFLEDPQANRLFERLKSKWNYNVTMMIFFGVRPSISYARLVCHKFYNCSRDCTITCKSITEPVSEVNDNQTNMLGFSWFWNSLRI